MTFKQLALCGAAMAAVSNAPAWAQAGPAPDAVENDEIVVIGVRQQILEAAKLEREALNVQSVITADDIGQFPDQNIAESLQRLPGVVILRDEGEGRFVQVRGLPTEFTQVTVNNAQIGSSDSGGNRTVALDVIPSDLLSQVAVNKSLLPDQDHDSLGAKIDLKPLSAFDRSESQTARITAQGTFTEQADALAPKISGDFTRRFDAKSGEVGLAVAANYFERKVGVDRLEASSGAGLDNFLVATQDFTTPTTFDGDVFAAGAAVAQGTVFDNDAFDDFGAAAAGLPLQTVFAPSELDQRVERGDRERIGLTFTTDYKADNGSQYQFSVLYGRLDDNDVRIQQEVELRDASAAEFDDDENDAGEDILVVDAGELGSLAPGEGVFSDVDLERQTFFQPREEETIALHFEGLNPFGNGLTLSYAADYSKNEFTLNNGVRGRFRARDNIVGATFDGSSGDFTVLGTGEFDRRPDQSRAPDFTARPDLGDFDFDGFLLIDEEREDEIFSFNADLLYEFDFGGRAASIKVGGKYRERDRSFLRGENGLDPSDGLDDGGAGIDLTLADVDTFIPDTELSLGGGLTDGGAFQNLDDARALFAEVLSVTGLQATELRNDFTAGEDTIAGYVQASLEFTDALSVITGFRVERTDFESSGLVNQSFISAEDDNFPGLNISDVLSFENDYTEFLPHFHLRWEPTDDTLVRFSYYRGLVRPSFGDASALRNFNVLLDATAEQIQDPGQLAQVIAAGDIDEAEFEGGNPLLNPTTADQFDASFGYYHPDAHTTFTVAAFYKDISDLIVGAEISDPDLIAALVGDSSFSGVPVANLETPINAESAEIYGVEFGFSHFLTYLDIPIVQNLFATGNATLLNAETETFGGVTTQLPGASEESANLSLGYEDDRLLLRGALNFRGEQLRSLSDEPAENEFRDEFIGVDLSVRYQVTDDVQLFGDVINIFEEPENRFFQGATGPVFERFEDFGRTWQFGVTATF